MASSQGEAVALVNKADGVNAVSANTIWWLFFFFYISISHEVSFSANGFQFPLFLLLVSHRHSGSEPRGENDAGFVQFGFIK